MSMSILNSNEGVRSHACSFASILRAAHRFNQYEFFSSPTEVLLSHNYHLDVICEQYCLDKSCGASSKDSWSTRLCSVRISGLVEQHSPIGYISKAH